MTDQERPLVVALEEHYWDRDLAALFPGREGKQLPPLEERLFDLGDLRLKEMDEGGIDIQVLSHGAPATQKLDAATSIRMASQTNDRLAAFISANPARFAAFCVLPTPDPQAAADELERCVTKLGFKGAMIHGLTNGKFIDEKQFWPIFAQAEALDVPIYLHPSSPSPAVIDAYYKEYVPQFPSLIGPALGFTFETATQAVRLVLSEVFKAHPRLKIILGHLGEGIPFLLWRIDQALSRPGNRGESFKDIFRRHFHLTTSGNFSDTALACSIAEMSIDRILFSVDWPFVANKPGTDWLMKSSLSAGDKAKIFGGNAKALLKL